MEGLIEVPGLKVVAQALKGRVVVEQCAKQGLLCLRDCNNSRSA